jgi:hypothetical protein
MSALVLIEGNRYSRFDGSKVSTHVIDSDTHLTAAEVEEFRVRPDQFCGTPEEFSDAPGAA